MSSRVEIVPINTGSNGDPSHRPSTGTHTLDDPPTNYLEKLGTLWMKHRGDARPGILYKLDKLPDGYTVWEKPRKTDPKHVDKWLFGNPNHKTFDSPNRFFPHFLHLMNSGGNSVDCPCTVCTTRGRSMSTAGVSTRLPGADAASHEAVNDIAGVPLDCEGTPDVFQILIDKLKRDHKLDTPITQLMSLNWCAHRLMAQGILETLAGTANWLPRPLEMALFVREFEKDEELCRDSSGNFRLYNTKTKAFSGFPEWEAGVIGEVPQEELRLDDLITETEKETNVSMSGIRVEPYSNPNLASTSTKDNKFWSKRHKYVPMHHVRPFIFWQEYLRGIPEQEWHPTIKHVLTAMATLALTDRVRFQGTWPSARVFCKGMYLGSEYIVVGDVVRLMPTTIDPTVTDIMRIHSIKLKLLELDISTDDEGNSLRSPPLVCHISGEGYTLDPAKTMTKLPIDPDLGLLPREFYGYGDWYPVGPPKSLRQVPFSHILGRCYEPDAMQLWFSTPISPDNRADLLSLGAAGTIAAREYARCHDKRIKDGAIRRWNFSETRIDALDLERHVNLEVGRMGLHGDKRLWLKHCRQLNTLTGPEGPAALRAAAKVAAASPNGGPPELAEDLETENTGKGIVVEFSMRKNRAHTTADDVDRTSLAGAGFESDELQANNIADDESESDGSKEYESEEGGEGDGSEEDGSEDDGSEDDGNEGTEKGGEQVDDENEDELAVAMQLVDELQEPHGDVMDVNANEEGNVVMSHRGMDSALDPPRKKQKIYVDEMD